MLILQSWYNIQYNIDFMKTYSLTKKNHNNGSFIIKTLINKLMWCIKQVLKLFYYPYSERTTPTMDTVNELWNQLTEDDKAIFRKTRTDTMYPTASVIRFNNLEVDMIGFYYTSVEEEWNIDMDTNPASLSAKKVKVLYKTRDSNSYTTVVRDLDSYLDSIIEIDGRRILPTTIKSTDFKLVFDKCKFIR